MNNDNQSGDNSRRLPFSHNFHIGTTIQNVFRNINHAFSHNHESSGQQRDDDLRDRTDDIPPLEPLDSVGGAHDMTPTDTAHRFPSFPAPNSSISSVSPPADVDMPPSQPDSQHDDDEDSMPELRSVSDSSDSSDVGVTAFSPVAPHQDVQPVGDDRDNVRTDDEGDPPLQPITGIRRARVDVDDDGDDARDRRHPSERVGGPPPPGDAAPQNANPQQPPRPPAGLFGALFGLGPPGTNLPAREGNPEHVQTGEDTVDPSPTGNDATPGRAPRGVPILTAGFTLTIPLFGPPQGNQPGPAPGGQGGPPGLFNMDAAAREELFASFAAFFQEFQAMDEAREDPERAKKLVAGLEEVPLGLVKRLERVGGAPGGHHGDIGTEGSSSGCAICWDTLLDGESDNFTGQQSSSPATDNVLGQNETHTESGAMEVDAPSVSHSEADTSASTPLSSEAPKIISLPCAHVFHASCLLPWFTRAKQATCPTCRFNIDPENLTYTPPPRRAFNRPSPAQPDNGAANPAPFGPQAAPEVPLGAPATGTHAADATAPPVDPARTTADPHPAAAAVPPGPAPPPPSGQAGVPPAGPGFNPFATPGIPILSFPAIQIPLRPTAAQAPGDENQGIDIMTIGLDMFVGGLPPEARDGDPRDNAEGADGTNNGGAGTGTAGNGAANTNGLAQDLHSLIEGLLRTTQGIIPQVINAQAPAPAPAPDGSPADGPQPQPQVRPAPEAAGPQPDPPPAGGPRGVPIFPFHMFRPTRPMPPRRERKTWTLPPAPGPSLRQRVEQREREQGLRCSDMSCGVGPCDEDPYPESSVPLMKQVCIHPLPDIGDHQSDGHSSVCAHAFHPACLISAERVAGWGGEDKTEPLVEVSCPVCRAVGCVTREEWESGVSAL